MYHVSAASKIDHVAKEGETISVISSLFFIGIVILGNFFVMNLFIGVIISKYNREKDLGGHETMLTEAQKKWVKNRLNLLHAQPIFNMKVPIAEWRQPFYFIAQNSYLQHFVNIILIINTIILSL